MSVDVAYLNKNNKNKAKSEMCVDGFQHSNQIVYNSCTALFKYLSATYGLIPSGVGPLKINNH